MPIRRMRPSGSVLATGLQAFVDTLPEGLLVAEVGSYTGESLMFWLQKASQVICVDRWADYSENIGGTTGRMVIDRMDWVEHEFDRIASHYGDRVVKVIGDSLEVAARCPPATFDLVYLDAGHTYDQVVADILAWAPTVKPGGLLAGHDYDTLRASVRQAVDDLFGGPEQLHPDSTWVVQMTVAMQARLKAQSQCLSDAEFVSSGAPHMDETTPVMMRQLDGLGAPVKDMRQSP